METMSVKNHSPSLPYKKYTLPINSELLVEILRLDPSLESGSFLLFGRGILTQIFFNRQTGQSFLQTTTSLGQSRAVVVLESILSASEETRRISQSMGNWRKSIVVA